MALNNRNRQLRALNQAGLSSIGEYQSYLCDIAKQPNDGAHKYVDNTEECFD
jgi:hypothetical protein